MFNTHHNLIIIRDHLCAVSDNNGKFVFRNIQCGKYKIIPSYKDDITEFDVNPSQYDFTLTGIIIINFMINYLKILNKYM